MAVKWEYLVKTYTGEQTSTLLDFLNKFGNDGWELIAVVGQFERLYFKRRID